jgi:hypothetical protein
MKVWVEGEFKTRRRCKGVNLKILVWRSFPTRVAGCKPVLPMLVLTRRQPWLSLPNLSRSYIASCLRIYYTCSASTVTHMSICKTHCLSRGCPLYASEKIMVLANKNRLYDGQDFRHEVARPIIAALSDHYNLRVCFYATHAPRNHYSPTHSSRAVLESNPLRQSTTLNMEAACTQPRVIETRSGGPAGRMDTFFEAAVTTVTL